MNHDPVRHSLEIDLTDALQKFHDGRSVGRSEDSEMWMNLHKAALMCGYAVTAHYEQDRAPVALVTNLVPEDKDMASEWALYRERYRLIRAIEHNDIHPEHVEKWEPNDKDRKVLSELGIAWPTPSQSPMEPPARVPVRRRRAEPSQQ
jgi:hypothetical protein